WVDGRRVDGAAKDAVDLVSPWTGERVGALHGAGVHGVDSAVASARRAFAAHRFATAAERIARLQAAASAIEQAADRLVDAAVTFIGKPRRAARFEMQRSAQFVRACATHLAGFGGDTIPLDVAKAGAGLFGFTQRMPYGVVGAITPFNAPANLL